MMVGGSGLSDWRREKPRTGPENLLHIGKTKPKFKNGISLESLEASKLAGGRRADEWVWA